MVLASFKSLWICLRDQKPIWAIHPLMGLVWRIKNQWSKQLKGIYKKVKQSTNKLGGSLLLVFIWMIIKRWIMTPTVYLWTFKRSYSLIVLKRKRISYIYVPQQLISVVLLHATVQLAWPTPNSGHNWALTHSLDWPILTGSGSGKSVLALLSPQYFLHIYKPSSLSRKVISRETKTFLSLAGSLWSESLTWSPTVKSATGQMGWLNLIFNNNWFMSFNRTLPLIK